MFIEASTKVHVLNHVENELVFQENIKEFLLATESRPGYKENSITKNKNLCRYIVFNFKISKLFIIYIYEYRIL